MSICPGCHKEKPLKVLTITLHWVESKKAAMVYRTGLCSECIAEIVVEKVESN